MASDKVARARAQTSGLGGRVHRALAGRVFDGVAFAEALTVDGLHPDLAALVAPEPKFSMPWPSSGTGSTGSTPSRPTVRRPVGTMPLEYDFGVTVARDKGEELDLVGGSTPTGRVDWYSFDLAGVGTTGGGATPWEVTGVIPGPVTFAGMPHPRWWQIEDASVSLGHLRADATDLSKLLVTDFALVYGNDWLSVPLPQPVGTLAEITASGHRRLRPPYARAGRDRGGGRRLEPVGPVQRVDPLSGAQRTGQHLFLPPVAPSSGTGPVLEEAAFVRDEAANVVWAVETIVPDGLGGGRDGADAGRRLRTALDPTGPAGSPAPAGAPGRAGCAGCAGGPAGRPALPVRHHRAGELDPVPAGEHRQGHPLDASGAVLVAPRRTGGIPRPTGDQHPPVRRDDRRRGHRQLPRQRGGDPPLRRTGPRRPATRAVDRRNDRGLARPAARAGRGEGASGLRFDVLEVDAT